MLSAKVGYKIEIAFNYNRKNNKSSQLKWTHCGV